MTGCGRYRPRQLEYPQTFSAYLRENANRIPSLTAVLTRPRELTRKQLKELCLALDMAGYPEPACITLIGK
jgi:type I restriction enzyme R subunit